MKNKKYILIFIILIFFKFVMSSDEIKFHFYNEKHEPIEKVEFIYNDLIKYFKDKVPDMITVKYIKTPISIFGYDYSFATRGDTVLINEEHKSDLIRLVAHESCHICFYYTLKEICAKEKYRFFNEGFCRIFDSIVVDEYENILFDQADAYKKAALAIAANENKKNNVSFKKVQKWFKYFGKINIENASGKTNYYAYPVGSSFVYYIFDTYGIDSFFSFVNDLANSDDMNISFKKNFKKSKSEIEKEWLEYLGKVKID